MSLNVINKHIFPGLLPEVDNQIIYMSDGKSLCQLQLVNKAAFNVLTNKKFKSFFEFKHPYLFDDHFPLHFLVTLRPDICWKFATHAMEVSDLDLFLSKSLTDRFLFAGFPDLCTSWKLEIRSLEQRRKEICGSCPFDPHSDIDRAWKLSQLCTEGNEIRELTQQLECALGEIHTSSEVEIIKKELSESPELDHWVNHLEGRSDEELGLLKRKYIPEYKCIFKSYIEKYLDLQKRSQEGAENYGKLESERLFVESETSHLLSLITKHEDICTFLEIDMQRQEAEHESICGTRPYDTSSNIHIAWTSCIETSPTPFNDFFNTKILGSPVGTPSSNALGSLLTSDTSDAVSTQGSYASPLTQDTSGTVTPGHLGGSPQNIGGNLSLFYTAIYKALEGKRVETVAKVESTKNELIRFQSLKEGIDIKSHEPSKHLDPYREQLTSGLKKAKEMEEQDQLKRS